MESVQSTNERVLARVRNIGGIESTEVEFGPGVNVLTGRNATNRTSLLQALMAALGSEKATLKGDADEGTVELGIGDETYTRRLTRRDGTVVTDGDPYLADAQVADLFAFLLEGNDARRAVERGENLRELIMRPVDTDAIQRDIERLVSERREIEAELETLDDVENRRSDIESRRTELESEIESKTSELERKEERISDIDIDIGEKRREGEKLEEKLEDIGSTRSELEDVRYDIGTQRESIAALEEELQEYEERREDLPEASDGREDELEDEIDRLRDRQATLDSRKNRLESIIRFNEEALEGSEGLLDGDRASPTDRLVGDRVTCWTCGTEVEEERIHDTIEELQNLRREIIEERNELRRRIDDLEDERGTLRETERERRRIEQGIERVEREIERREERIEGLHGRQTELEERIEELEAEIQTLDQEDYGEVLEVHREANELEFEIGRLRSELEDVENELDRMADRLDEREALEARAEEVETELEEQRTRIERIEREAVEQFNTHMETLVDTLGYANLERVWIERTEREVPRGRSTTTEGEFDLHVVRRAESGSVYEDTVDHLSESEREVTGLVFALAGYLAHDVYEEMPFILFDSLEAIDAERIAALIDYVREYADYLVVALLPEDAAALDDDYRRVTDI
jgi:DNA repair exonuclease SbcCD ATPase subunit